MLRGVLSPYLAPGILVYSEIWSRGSQPLIEVQRAIAWELARNEECLPPAANVHCTEDGFIVMVHADHLYDRLLDFSDVIFIDEGCYVLAMRGLPPSRRDRQRNADMAS